MIFLSKLKNIRSNIFTLLTSIAIIILLIVHGLWDGFFKIDNTSVLLLLILILLPYFPLITKIKFGDFEAEITHKEIKDIRKKIEDIPKKEEDTKNPKKGLELKNLAIKDPNLALAKVRIEMEKKLRFLTEIYLDEKGENLSMRNMIQKLEEKKIIDSNLGSLLRDISNVANRAIHGEDVSKQDAIELVDFAGRAMDELSFVVIKHALKSEHARIIKPKDVDKYGESKYILKTVIPYVDNPQLKTYKLNQAELNAFLEGYDEYAEFLVGLEKAEKTKSAKK